MPEQNYICVTCGTQYPATAQPPEHCPICEDDRQYIGYAGQKWTTPQDLRQDSHNVIKTLEPGLTGIGTHPQFAIGQRALLVQTPQGNVLWDCISLIDEPTVAAVKALGGVSAIAISHPHFYSSMIEWSRAFGVPIYLHVANRPWVMYNDPTIQFWEGEKRQIAGGLTLLCCGGHFPGSTALHWPDGAEGRGALLTGDTIQVVADRRYLSFMYSYPNVIPLPPASVQRIAGAVAPYRFDRLYGGWWDSVVRENAAAHVAFSAKRYIEAIGGRRAN